jgi:hypothetical protein
VEALESDEPDLQGLRQRWRPIVFVAAEAAAIKAERPKFNRQHTDDPSKPMLGGFIIADAFEASRARIRSQRRSP